MGKLPFFLGLLFISIPSYAYIGPGMAGGVIAATLGFVLAILLMFWGIMYYPIKRFFKNRKEKKKNSKATEDVLE